MFLLSNNDSDWEMCVPFALLSKHNKTNENDNRNDKFSCKAEHTRNWNSEASSWNYCSWGRMITAAVPFATEILNIECWHSRALSSTEKLFVNNYLVTFFSTTLAVYGARMNQTHQQTEQHENSPSRVIKNMNKLQQTQRCESEHKIKLLSW